MEIWFGWDSKIPYFHIFPASKHIEGSVKKVAGSRIPSIFIHAPLT